MTEIVSSTQPQETANDPTDEVCMNLASEIPTLEDHTAQSHSADRKERTHVAAGILILAFLTLSTLVLTPASEKAVRAESCQSPTVHRLDKDIVWEGANLRITGCGFGPDTYALIVNHNPRGDFAAKLNVVDVEETELDVQVGEIRVDDISGPKGCALHGVVRVGRKGNPPSNGADPGVTYLMDGCRTLLPIVNKTSSLSE